MKIQIHNMKNLNEKQQLKIKTALLAGEPVLDSIQFKDRVLVAKFTETMGHTNEEILAMILSGSHDGGPADEIIDVNIEGFYRRSSVVGYTYLGSTWQWINRKFLDNYSSASIFHHVMHESMHRSYRFRHVRAHATSVPYLIGSISQKAFTEFYSKPRNASFLSVPSIFKFID